MFSFINFNFTIYITIFKEIKNQDDIIFSKLISEML